MLYELRVYEVMPGRMRDLVARFSTMNVKLFERHGIRVVGYWTTDIGQGNEFTYMLAWQDWADREARWGAFVADPELHATMAETERNGPLISSSRNQMLRPTAFSPLA